MESKTIEALSEAGWFRGRKVGRAQIEELVCSLGFSPTAQQIDFLDEYSGLRVVFSQGGQLDCFWVDLEEAVRQTFSEWVKEYSERAGESLIPVGYSNSDHLLLLVGSDGSLFGGFDDLFERLGVGTDAGLDSIVLWSPEVNDTDG